MTKDSLPKETGSMACCAGERENINKLSVDLCLGFARPIEEKGLRIDLGDRSLSGIQRGLPEEQPFILF